MVEAAEKSTDAYAWSLALLPLFGIVVSWFAWDGTAESADAINGILPWVTIALSLGFAFLDERTLRPLADRPSPAWVFLTPCAYLLVRVLRVPRSNPAPLIVSVAFVAIWITVSVAQAGNVI